MLIKHTALTVALVLTCSLQARAATDESPKPKAEAGAPSDVTAPPANGVAQEVDTPQENSVEQENATGEVSASPGAEQASAAPDAPHVQAVSSPPEEEEAADLRVPRSKRRFALMAVLGWNSLVGFGVGGSFSIIPNLAADLAVGLGGIGLKGGVRVRANLLTSNWTPTLGVGLQLAPGSAGEPVNLTDSNGGTTVLQVEQSAFLQPLIGLSYQGDHGFSALIASGYSFLLDKDNVRLISGDPEVAKLERTLCHGGLVVELGLGYAF